MQTDETSERRMLVVEEVADLLRCSTRVVRERARLREIPHRRLAGCRRLIFPRDELRAWIDGAPLQVLELGDGARIVTTTGHRPKQN